MTPSPVDLLIRNGFVVSMDSERRVFSPGAVAIRGREIVAVGPEKAVVDDVAPTRVIDAQGGPVHPGFVETHMHVSHQLIRNAFGDTTPWESITDVFFDDYWRTIDDDDEYAGSVLGCLEMIRNGTTCFIEAGSVFEPDATAKASTMVGMRAVIADGFIWDIGAFAEGETHLPRSPDSTRDAIDRLGGQLGRNADPDALVRGHIAIWGLGTASDELYSAAKELAQDSGVVLNAHQSFAQLDAEGERARLGRAPVVHYQELGVLNEATLLAHANFIDDDEAEVLATCGTSVAWCPSVTMNWATGGAVRGRHAELHHRGCNVSLGSDSSIVGNPLDLAHACSLGILTSRDSTNKRSALNAEATFEMATINGARAVGMDTSIGSLEVDKRADVVIRSPSIPELCPDGRIIDQLVYAGAARGIRTVVIDGKVVLEDGDFVEVDEAKLQNLGREAARRVYKRMGWTITGEWPIIRG
jgi:cytosine/adenosine deaminase-related metal-dependent hydrolase